MNDGDVPHRVRRRPRRPSLKMVAPLFASATSSSSLDDGSGDAYGEGTNLLSALLRKLRGGEDRAPSKLQVAISAVLYGSGDSSSSTSSTPPSSASSSASSSSSSSTATFRPSAKFLSSRLGRAWLEQLESQRALLTGAAGAAARAAGAADAAGRARLADAKASLGAQLAWDRAKAEWLASQLLEAGENGILNPANIVLDAYVAGKARYYLRRHALRTAAVLATACLLIDGLKSAAAAVARGAAASKLVPFLPRLRGDANAAAAAAAVSEADTSGAAGREEREKAEGAEAEKEKEQEAAKTTGEGGPTAAAPRRKKRSEKARHLLRLAASGAVALGRKAVEAALPTPLLAAWLVAELML